MPRVHREISYLLTALMYFTRIPGDRNAPYDRASQQQALKYFPLIGWLVGAVGAATLYLGQTLLPLPIAVIAAVSVAIVLTGAMHEDGLADCFDAFGGAFEAERVLAIMKDSRVGTYGVLALVVGTGLKTALLLELAKLGVGRAALAMMFAHATSRFVVLLVPSSLDYVQHSPASKSRPMVGERLPVSCLLVGAAFVVAPLLFLTQGDLWIATGVALLSAIGLRRYFKFRIGGYTGDCLGATQQISELLIYLTILAAWTST